MSGRRGVTELTLVQRCIEDIRHMILTGELLPGETLRQETLAERLGASPFRYERRWSRCRARGSLPTSLESVTRSLDSIARNYVRYI